MVETQEGFLLSRSPQSTLAGSWTGRSTIGSSNGSPNGPSLVSSPPTTPLGGENDAWDLIFQDVGHVDRLKMTAGDGSRAKNGLLPSLCPAKNTISGVHISAVSHFFHSFFPHVVFLSLIVSTKNFYFSSINL